MLSTFKDLGIATMELALAGYKKIKYTSFHDDPKVFNFGKQRLLNHMTDLWMKGTLILEGCPFEKDAPPLTAVELAAIPGADVAQGKLECLTLKVTCRSSEKIVIIEDLRREWSSGNDQFAAEFKALEETHNKSYASALCSLLKPQLGNPGSSTDGTPGGAPEPEDPVPVNEHIEEMNSLDELRAAKQGKAVETGASDAMGITQIFVGDEEVWLLSSEDS